MAINRCGQVTLPVILVISGVIIEIAIAFTFISYFSSTSGLGERLSVRAESAAMAGIRDALIKLARDKDVFSTSPNCSIISPYSLNIDGNTVEVYPCRFQDPPSSPNCPNECRWIYIILARATVASVRKQINAVIVVEQLTGVVRVQSIKEVPYTPP